jgi:hypothetical protein
MFHLYFIVEDEGRYWVPVNDMNGDLNKFKDSQDAAEFALSIVSAQEYKIVSDKHDRTMRGLRFGSEVIWRINGSKKPIQYRTINENRFIG